MSSHIGDFCHTSDPENPERHANVNVNSTPLLVASFCGRVKATRLLLDYGANIHERKG